MKLPQAALDHLGPRAARVDVLAWVHRKPDAKVSRQRSNPAQLFAVLGSPVIRERRVRGEVYQILSHPEVRVPSLRVPSQDGPEFDYVPPVEPLKLFHIRDARQP